MTAERPINQDQIRLFFDKPAAQVVPQLSNTWLNHENRSKAEVGQGKILAIASPSGTIRLFRIEEVIIYSNDYTYGRWPNTRAPEIDSLQAGDLISYVSRAATLTFIKTQRAENIQFSHLTEVDKYGDPIRSRESVLGASGVAKTAGLAHKERSRLLPFNLRGEQGLLLVKGQQMLTEADLKRIEEEIMGDALTEEELLRIEKEVLDDSRK